MKKKAVKTERIKVIRQNNDILMNVFKSVMTRIQQEKMKKDEPIK